MTDTVESQSTRWLRRPGRRTTWVVAAIVAIGLVVAAPLAFRWWTHPDLLPDSSSTTSFWAPQPVDEAATAFALLPWTASGRPTSLTWHGATAVLANNTAHAEVTFSLCDTSQLPDPDATSWPATSLVQICSAQRDLTDGMRLSYPNPDQVVLMTLTPTSPGRVHVTGVDLRYSLGADHLFQHGTDHTVLDVRLTAG